MKWTEIFRFKDDKLPTELPFREAVKIYLRQAAVMAIIALIGSLILSAVLLLLTWGG